MNISIEDSFDSYRNKNIRSIYEFEEELKKYINYALKSSEIKQIDLSNLNFPKRFIFDLGDYLDKNRACPKAFIAKNTVFSGSAIFSDVKFLSEVNFENSAFNSRAIFNNTEFFSTADFTGVNFHRQVSFFRTIFQKDSKVSFNHSKFHENAYFNESKFLSDQGCVFEYSSFQRPTAFNSAYFRAETTFLEVIFFESSNFNKITVDKQINFNATKFRGETKFIQAQINHEINFSRISISNLLLFKNLVLNQSAKIKISELLITKKPSKIIITNIEYNFYSDNTETKQKENFEFTNLNLFSNEPVIVIRNYHQSHKIKLFKFENCFLERGAVLLENCNLIQMHHLIQADPILFDGFLFKHCQLPSQECPSLLIPNLIKVKTIDGFLERKNFWEILKKILKKIKLILGSSLLDEKKELLRTIKYQRIKLARHRKEKYAMLKTIALGEGEKQLSSDFFFNQMYWANLEKRTFINSFYYLTCGYGLSWFKPLFFYLLFLVLFTSVYSSLIYSMLLESSESSLLGFDLFSQPKLFQDIKDANILTSALTISILGSSPVPVDFFVGQILKYSGVEISVSSYASIFTFYLPQKLMQIFFLFELGSAIRNNVER